MRNHDRIDRIINKLTLIASQCPYVGFLKMIMLILDNKFSYYLEDDVLEDFLAQYDLNKEMQTNVLWQNNESNTTYKTTILLTLRDIWEYMPDLRFTQLICNLFSGIDFAPYDFINISDNDIKNYLTQTYCILKGAHNET